MLTYRTSVLRSVTPAVTTMPDPGVTWRIATPASAPGAIAIIELTGPSAELAGAMERLRLPRPVPGVLRLVDLVGVDQGVFAAWSDRCVHLMPHGGLVVVREMAAALTSAGIAEARGTEILRDRFPEAADDDEALVLAALGRAQSPRAVDLLLDQPNRWRRWRAGSGPGPSEEHSAMLDRLIHPPLVAAVGPTNIGKSSLTNALARDYVSIVADEPGTTRDHVGVAITMDGVVVRFVDTPGMRADAPLEERDAASLAWDVTARADLVLLCGDATAAPITPGWLAAGTPRLVVALRSDLGTSTGWRADVVTCARDGSGIEELARAIRRRLVSDAALEDARPWRPGLGGAAARGAFL